MEINMEVPTLVLMPHADDEYLGVGMLMSKAPANFQVVVAVSHGGGSEELPHVQGNALADWRESESQLFCKTIGVKPPEFLRLGYPFELGFEEQKRLREYCRACLGKGYKQVITTHPEDRHTDHQLLGRVVLEELGKVMPVWFCVISGQAVKAIRKPDYVFELTHQEWEVKGVWSQIYKSQKHFLPKYFINTPHFRHERFWKGA